MKPHDQHKESAGMKQGAWFGFIAYLILVAMIGFLYYVG